MIPKLIHTVWLSGDRRPDLIQECLDSVATHNPDYELRIWGADDISRLAHETAGFYRQAVSLRKWAFATDWARLAILHSVGGIYVDGDVKCHASFDTLRGRGGFISWESEDLLGPHVIGSAAGHQIVGEWLNLYSQRAFVLNATVVDQTPMPDVITDFSVRHHGLRRNGHSQSLAGDFGIYTPGILTSKIDSTCIAEHLYAGSWLPKDGSSEFATGLRKSNARLMNGDTPARRWVQNSPLSGLIEKRRERHYQQNKIEDRKKSLVLVDPAVKSVPDISFWHVGAVSAPSLSTGTLPSNPLISVIVPIYNVEPYLDKCLRSLKDQSYGNLEVLLVNDGSTDGSLRVCESHAALDNRLKVFSKANGGLGSARNYGLERVSGDAVCFVDSDDFVEQDYIAEFVSCLVSGSDVAVCNHRQVFPDGGLISQCDSDRGLSKGDPIAHLLLSDAECYAWNKIFRRAIFEFEPFRFGDGWFEDFAIMPAVIGSVGAVAYTGKCSYNYVQREGSILASARNNPAKNLDIINCSRKLISLEPVFRPKYWEVYYDWKLIKHVLYYRWQNIQKSEDATARETALDKLCAFVNDQIPWWYESAFVKQRMSTGAFWERIRERNFVSKVRSRGRS